MFNTKYTTESLTDFTLRRPQMTPKRVTGRGFIFFIFVPFQSNSSYVISRRTLFSRLIILDYICTLTSHKHDKHVKMYFALRTNVNIIHPRKSPPENFIQQSVLKCDPLKRCLSSTMFYSTDSLFGFGHCQHVSRYNRRPIDMNSNVWSSHYATTPHLLCANNNKCVTSATKPWLTAVLVPRLVESAVNHLYQFHGLSHL